jgi:hypothetical protein
MDKEYEGVAGNSFTPFLPAADVVNDQPVLIRGMIYDSFSFGGMRQPRTRLTRLMTSAPQKAALNPAT